MNLKWTFTIRGLGLLFRGPNSETKLNFNYQAREPEKMLRQHKKF